MDNENQIDVIMRKGVYMVRGEVQFASSPKGVVSQVVPAWILVDESRNLISSQRFDTIYINGVSYPINTTTMFSIITELNSLLDDIVSKQHKTKTPMAEIMFDEKAKVIRVSGGF